MLEHIVSIKQFLDKPKLNSLFQATHRLQELPPSRYSQTLKGRTIATLFYEPSTRTRLSFESAILRLGGNVLSTENAASASSASKGESLEDTIRIINGYADAIIMRHKDAGAAERAARVSRVPIVNAGDGAGEHPTQALLDLYTIQQYKPGIDGLKIGLAGDLLNSRTLHSVLYLLAIYDVELYLIAPEACQLPASYKDYLSSRGIPYHISFTLDNCLDKLDVLYINRLQMERHAGTFTGQAPALTKQNLHLLKPDAIILNPLPRVTEIDVAIDTDPRAVYFEQAQNGLFIRMSLLQQLFA